MDINEIKALIELVDKLSFSVLALKKDDMELVLKKPNHEENIVLTETVSETIMPKEVILEQDTIVVNDSSPEVQEVEKTEPQEEKAPEMLKQEAPELELEQETLSIIAPLVGVFYSSATPEAEPFVTIGQTVQKGDTVCIIEAMKILNEIKAPVSGKIVKIHVNNNDVVEFNQILMEIGE